MIYSDRAVKVSFVGILLVNESHRVEALYVCTLEMATGRAASGPDRAKPENPGPQALRA